MLKMTIDNEEVLSNNDISIKEEILSPSSTILNNVYPKTWEQDKDYVSRFYYPKDYSKLNIQNFSVEPEEAGTTIQVNGNATLTDVDTTKESRVLRLLGQTSQVQYTGKNKIFWQSGSGGLSNLTVTQNSDKSINITGTPSRTWANLTPNIIYSIPAGTYTFSINQVLNNTIGVALFTQDEAYIVHGRIYAGNRSITITTTQDTTRFRIYLEGMNTSTSYSIKNLQIQLEQGSTATSYEPYVGGTASPNPSYPQNVNVVSGDNEINICGKNWLFSDFDNWESGEYNASGVKQTNTIRVRTKELVLVRPNTTYYFNCTSTNDSLIAREYDKNKNFIKSDGGLLNGATITTSSNCYYLGISLYSNTSQARSYEIYQTLFENETIRPFICLNSATNKTYEPYIGSSYPLYLGVENSWKSSQAIQGTFDNNTALASKRIVWFDKEVSNGETMTIICNNSNLRFAVSRTTMNTQSSSNTQAQNSGWQTGTYTITFNSNGYACLTISKTDDSAVAISSLSDSDFTITYNGNHISNTPIELCKIGTYQDYIYKENGSWYLHKEIGKVVLDGSEDWLIRTDVVQTGYTCFRNGSYVINSRYTDSNITNVYCNYFVVLAQYTGQPMIRIINVTEYGETIMFPSSIASTEANFKAWLSSHNTILYYVLPTPTDTEITDTNLIEQLESLSS